MQVTVAKRGLEVGCPLRSDWSPKLSCDTCHSVILVHVSSYSPIFNCDIMYCSCDEMVRVADTVKSASVREKCAGGVVDHEANLQRGGDQSCASRSLTYVYLARVSTKEENAHGT
jgi:hypothetical protein